LTVLEAGVRVSEFERMFDHSGAASVRTVLDPPSAPGGHRRPACRFPGASIGQAKEAAFVRNYDELIEVRRGLVAGCEAPEQFVWRGRLWRVCTVLSFWVETGAWWEQPGVSALFGSDSQSTSGTATVAELLDEREVWRVEAERSRLSSGVFDLAFGWGGGSWRLLRCLD
jgi:Domain of unknown function (DUF6504)